MLYALPLYFYTPKPIQMKQILRILVWLLLIIIVVAGGSLLYLSLSYYKPADITPAEFLPASETNTTPASDTLRLLSWNIGYAGLSRQMDFFYEGGTMVRPTKEILNENLQLIGGFMSSLDSVDFILLQEIDKRAKRSWYLNQLEILMEEMPARYAAFALNYNAKFVPIPPREPMGSVKAGLATFSHVKPDTSLRYSLPASYSWPMKLFMLHRCLLKQYFTLPGGKTLCLINTHNSAFDDAAEMRKLEMDMIKNLVNSEYEKGYYVIAGGDWNLNPPFFKGEFADGDATYFVENPIDSAFMPAGWKWAADVSVPTNRMVATPYKQGETETTVLDFFLCSPNIQVLDVKGLNRNFMVSDHNPVFLSVVLQ